MQTQFHDVTNRLSVGFSWNPETRRALASLAFCYPYDQFDKSLGRAKVLGRLKSRSVITLGRLSAPKLAVRCLIETVREILEDFDPEGRDRIAELRGDLASMFRFKYREMRVERRRDVKAKVIRTPAQPCNGNGTCSKIGSNGPLTLVRKSCVPCGRRTEMELKAFNNKVCVSRDFDDNSAKSVYKCSVCGYLCCGCSACSEEAREVIRGAPR